ncbi:MAG TPA: M23 family metallopeptidase, partial [Chloroflexi bacterium]|nr:M23 family metallopeptidase [Chloroflexota bacterium]
TAHLTVLLLAFAVLLLVGTDFSPTSVTPPSLTLPEHALQRPAALPASRIGHVGGPSKPVGVLASPPMGPPGILTRMAVPTTTIPVRPRRDVITYTVQPGDTIFGIAGAFGLAPETIYWANSETLHDNPHLLRPGMVLYILPTDGIYHTVQAGETVEGLAEKYGVEPEAILNAEWNHLKRGQPLQEGQKLVIPGGKREFVVWQLPKYASSGVRGRGNTGLCRGPFTGGIIGRGIFTWPTAGRRISGWYFRDRRNPAHGGIDIGLRLGDPVYAADNGLVVYAGWNTWGYGNLVVIDHGNGWQTWYAHLSQVNVSCGQSVWQGGIIGLGGSTGNSTGPHLHFESRYEGKPADPLSLLP